jgi:hypothetical protein
LKIFRGQKLFVISRSGKYFANNCWVDEIKQASVFPEKQADRMIKMDIGMDCEKLEVRPELNK